MKKKPFQTRCMVCAMKCANQRLSSARVALLLDLQYNPTPKDRNMKKIEKMKNERGIQALILGCTELPLLLNKNNCPVDCLDSVEIHLQKLIELAKD